MLVFYNKSGKATAYSDNGTDIYLYNGKPVAYFYDDCIYSFKGHHLGWFIDGWIRDHSGRCIFFTENSSGGPAKPARHAKPARSAKHAKPAKGARSVRPAKSAKSPTWSSISSELFFM